MTREPKIKSEEYQRCGPLKDKELEFIDVDGSPCFKEVTGDVNVLLLYNSIRYFEKGDIKGAVEWLKQKDKEHDRLLLRCLQECGSNKITFDECKKMIMLNLARRRVDKKEAFPDLKKRILKMDIRLELKDFAIKYKIGEYELAWKGKGWGIYIDSFVYDKSVNDFVLEPFPSSRDEEFFKDCRFELVEAKEIIEKLSEKKCQ